MHENQFMIPHMDAILVHFENGTNVRIDNKQLKSIVLLSQKQNVLIILCRYFCLEE